MDGNKKDEMREERNKLLKDSDYRVLPDYPAVNKEEWITYRQSLRDFPATWVEGTSFDRVKGFTSIEYGGIEKEG